MATNVIQLIYNADGSLLDKVNPFIASNNQAANNIQIIAPFPASDSISVNYYLRNARVTNYTQYLRMLKDTNGNIVYGKDIVDPSKYYYQVVKDWNVWQIPISSKALRAISKYHAGKVDVSITVREYKNFLVDETMTFKGTFGSPKSTTRGDVPLTGTADGDFYRCDYLDFTSASANLSFTLMDLAIWDELESRWIKGSSYEEALPTPSTEIGVDPAVFGMAITDVEPSVTEQILDRIADLESVIMGEIPEEVLSQMFVRKNLTLYYAELSFLQSGDKLYVERNGEGYVIDASDLPIHMDVLEEVDYFTFNKNYTPPEKLDGMLYYDNSGGKQTLTFVNAYPNGQVMEVNLGQELYGIGKNLNGQMYDGQIVAYTGVQGDHLTYLPASANSSFPQLNEMIGVLSTSVNTNEYGPVVVFGLVDDIDFSLIMEPGTDLNQLNFGTKLYLSANYTGKYTTVIPAIPHEAIWVATVMTFNAQFKAGRIFVNPVRLRTSQVVEGNTELEISTTEPTDAGVKMWVKLTGQEIII